MLRNKKICQAAVQLFDITSILSFHSTCRPCNLHLLSHHRHLLIFIIIPKFLVIKFQEIRKSVGDGKECRYAAVDVEVQVQRQGTDATSRLTKVVFVQ